MSLKVVPQSSLPKTGLPMAVYTRRQIKHPVGQKGPGRASGDGVPKLVLGSMERLHPIQAPATTAHIAKAMQPTIPPKKWKKNYMNINFKWLTKGPKYKPCPLIWCLNAKPPSLFFSPAIFSL